MMGISLNAYSPVPSSSASIFEQIVEVDVKDVPGGAEAVARYLSGVYLSR
jgi:hypothetical protein